VTVRVELHPAAVTEAAAARRWYAERDPEIGDAFMVALDSAVALISNGALRWPAYVHQTRRLLMRRFPFALIYRVSTDNVLVLAVAHQRRRPGYWATR